MAIDKVTSAAITDSAVTSAKVADGVLQPNFRNIIINGDMSIAQRGTSTTGIGTSNGYFSCDRWKTGTSGTNTLRFTQSQSTDVPSGQGFPFSLKMDCTTADASLSSGDRIEISPRFEGQNLQYLKKGTSSAESLTLSFWVKSNKTGTYIVELFDTNNTRQISQAYTIDSASTWEKKTLTFAGDTTGVFTNDNNASLQVSWFLAAGSNMTSGTLSTTWTSNTNANRAVGQVNLADSTSNEWYVTGVQLEAGTSASDFEFLPFDVQIDRCYRYYQKSYEYGTSVGTSTQTGFRTTGGHQGGNTTGYIEGGLEFFKIMRTSPTLTFYDHVGNSGKCARLATGTARYTNENIQSSNVSPRGCDIISVSGTSAGIIQLQFVAEAEL
jgi:hypothetical protein